MTISELEKLFSNTKRAQDALETKYRSGDALSRNDCVQMEKHNQRLHLIGRELWIRQGCPPGFDLFEKPHKKTPLPSCFSLNLTDWDDSEEVH